jgi:hypothetical protein
MAAPAAAEKGITSMHPRGTTVPGNSKIVSCRGQIVSWFNWAGLSLGE